MNINKTKIEIIKIDLCKLMDVNNMDDIWFRVTYSKIEQYSKLVDYINKKNLNRSHSSNISFIYELSDRLFEDRFGEKKSDILKFNESEESKNGSLIRRLTELKFCLDDPKFDKITKFSLYYPDETKFYKIKKLLTFYDNINNYPEDIPQNTLWRTFFLENRKYLLEYYEQFREWFEI